jgi:hypothetical protein
LRTNETTRDFPFSSTKIKLENTFSKYTRSKS